MKKTFTFGICAVAAVALTMAGCSKNSECCATSCADKDAAACKDKADSCCKSGAKKTSGTSGEMGSY